MQQHLPLLQQSQYIGVGFAFGRVIEVQSSQIYKCFLIAQAFDFAPHPA